MNKLRHISASCASLFLLGFFASANAATISDSSTGLLSPNTIIDFGVGLYADGTTITNQFSSQGITFAGPNTRYNDQGASGPYVFDGHVTGLNGSGSAGPDNILFSTAVTDVAFTYLTNPSNTTFSAYLDGALQESFVATTSYSGEGTNVYYGFTDILFDEISFSIAYNNHYFLLDNLQFNPAVVPVPAAAWLFGSALLGFIGFARRRSV